MRSARAACFLVLATSAANGSSLLYQDTFETGDPVDYSIRFGVPEIGTATGPFATRSLNFNSYGGYEQIRYIVPGEVRTLQLSFDVFTRGFLDAPEWYDYFLVVLLEAPTVNNFYLTRTGTIGVQIPYQVLPIGAFDDEEVVHVDMLLDENTARWTTDINGSRASDLPVNELATTPRVPDLFSVRFCLCGSFIPSSVGVYLDNIRLVADVPLPGTLGLAMASIFALTRFVRRQKSQAETSR
jgi:hypothetical protein